MRFPELKIRVMNVMRKHIGKDNYLLSEDFFEKVYKKSPEDYDIYERRYLWEAILRTNSWLRSKNEMFILTNYNKNYVLKTSEEKELYHKVQDARKKAIDGLKKNATIWVKQKKWQNLKKQKLPKEEEEVVMVQ